MLVTFSTDHPAQRHAAQFGPVLRFLQLITDFAAFGLDAHQVILDGHARLESSGGLAVKRIHLCCVALKHAYLAINSHRGPVGVVGFDQHIHAGHPPLFPRYLLSDTGHTPCGRDLASGIDRLGQIEPGHIGASHPKIHPHHVHVGQHIRTGG